eukprot:TRINITY_DN36540_c0_g1_i2.p1 TRINITY_DN36540_c0_g1~~TRINITY_DN36540_c0_g1_i2.p1  ORF type:complete len:325 (-),score=36.02 TRINITY_DN36540_c0_g1_i2:161-1135(-)
MPALVRRIALCILVKLGDAASSSSLLDEAQGAPSRDLADGGVDVSEPPNALRGHAVSNVNLTLLLIIFIIVAATGVGHYIDRHHLWQLGARGHPKAWLLGMLAASYTLLLPGIYGVLFSYNIYIALQLDLYGVPVGFAENLTKVATTESMESLIRLLNHTGGHLGAFFVVLYAIILPCLKLVLLLLGELWRNSPEDSERRLMSRRCISFVQAVSKWASPDMFAYILLLYLLRHLGCPPEVQSKAKLDVGFLCFSIFCVSSTLSSLAIQPPPVPSRDSGGASLPALVVRQFGLGRVTGILTILFVLLMGCGIFVPCMGLRLSAFT